MVDMIARIRGMNDTKAAFDAVARDAQNSAVKVAAAGETAAVGLRAETAALRTLEQTSNLAAMQSKNLLFQLNDIGVSLAGGMNPLMVLAQQGGQIATIWGPEEGGVGRAFKETGNMALGLVTKFWPVAAVVTALTVGVGAMTTEINRNQKQQVGWGDVVTATWQLATENILKAFKPVTDALGGFWDWVSPMIAQGMNNTIGVFVFGFNAIKDVWAALPGAMGDVTIQAAQNTINGVMWMGREVIASINGIITHANGLLKGMNLPGMNTLGEPGKILPDVKLDNPFAGAGSDLLKTLGKDAADAFGTDYLGMIGDRARQIASLSDETKKLADGTDVFGKMLSNVSSLLHDANDPLTELQSNMDQLGALLNAGKISWEEYGEAVSKANLNAASGVLGAVGQITGALSRAFEGNKAIAVANAVINTAEGITKALAQGGIFGYASAVAIGITGAAQVASILSAKPGSASVAGVGNAPSTGSGSATAAAAPRQAINITLQGSGGYSRAQVEELLNSMADAMGDGAGSRLINVITTN